MRRLSFRRGAAVRFRGGDDRGERFRELSLDTLVAGDEDERLFVYGEDVDLCARADEAGFDRVMFQSIMVEHVGGVSLAASAMQSSAMLALKLLDELFAQWRRLTRSVLFASLLRSVLSRGSRDLRSRVLFKLLLSMSGASAAALVAPKSPSPEMRKTLQRRWKLLDGGQWGLSNGR